MRSLSCSALLCALSLSCASTGSSTAQLQEVHRIMNDARYRWVTVVAPNIRIHFVDGSFAAGVREQLPARVAEAKETVLRRLGVPGYAHTLDIFYVDRREDMQNLTGAPVTGFAYFRENAVVLVFNDEWRAFERHELTHVVTLGTWDAPAGPSSVEGLATFVDGDCGGYEIGRLARTMLDSGALIDLETLTNDFRRLNDLVAYIEAATIIAFAVGRQGPAVIRVLWRNGLQDAPKALGVTTSVFENQFRDWLVASFDPVPNDAWAGIRSRGCGIETLLGDQP